MSDITFCTNQTCLLKDTCKRQTSKPNEYSQSYAYFHPINEDPKEYQCVMYLKQTI